MAADSVTAVKLDVELHPRIKAERERRLVESADDCKKKRFDLMVERKMAHLLPPRLEGENPEAMEPTTVFHQHKEIDYQGRFVDFAAFWCQGCRSIGYHKDHACFVPKKCFFVSLVTPRVCIAFDCSFKGDICC